MITVSAVMDFINTYKSEHAVAKLVARVVTTATVIRDGEAHEIKLRELVPGDVVSLSAGDIIPADCQVIEADDFFVDQSALTGESFPVEKITGRGKNPNAEITLADKSIVFMGTSAVSGFAKVLVVNTGRMTKFGGVAERLSEVSPQTDFEKNIRSFSLLVLRLTILMVIFVFVANTLVGRDMLESFIFAVAIAVGLTPELLPVIMTVSLSKGSLEMAKSDVIVKNLSAIESFGSMNILCTDKTGTLTQNKIELVTYIDYLGKTSEESLRCAYLSSIYHTGVTNPLDTAIKEYKKLKVSDYKKIDEIPFDFERRRGSMVVEKNGKRTLITKGAPESIFDICTSYLEGDKQHNLSGEVKKIIKAKFEELSQEGLRVLALAEKEVEFGRSIYLNTEEKALTFIGFVTFFDPAKPGMRSVIDSLENLKIEIKILTGDSEILTQKICKDVNVPWKGIVTGDNLRKMSDPELIEAVQKSTIFARIDPEQKEKIIRVLKDAGNVVGYLGDGINDAPALRAADIGISVDNAVDIARETADIILVKKSLEVLKQGVIDGRKTFQNTLKYILMVLSSNFGNMFSMMGASAFLPFLPMLPQQILLNNFLYDSSQFSLTIDNVDPESIQGPPRWDLTFIKKFMLVFGSISSVFDFLTYGILLLVFRLGESQFQSGWFIESIATQVFVIYFIRTRKLAFIQSSPSAIVIINTILVVLIAWMIPFSTLGRLFSFGLLPVKVIISISALVVTYFGVTEVVKHYFFKVIKNH